MLKIIMATCGSRHCRIPRNYDKKIWNLCHSLANLCQVKLNKLSLLIVVRTSIYESTNVVLLCRVDITYVYNYSLNIHTSRHNEKTDKQ